MFFRIGRVFLAAVGIGVCLCASSLCRVHAQTGMMSPYSVFGPGIVQPYLNVRNMALGGIGTGLSGRGNMNPLNPATYRTGVDTLSVRFDIGFNVSLNGLTQEMNGLQAKNHSTSGGLSNIEFYFPVCKWYKMAIYLLPLTDMFYKTSYFSDNGDLNPYVGQTQLIHEGNGGISKLGWGHALGWGPVTAGVNLSYLFGKLMQTSTLKFLDDTLAKYAGASEYYTETRLNGFGLDVGLTAVIPIKEYQTFTIGAAYSLQSTLHAKRTTLAQGVFGSYSDTAYMPEAETRGRYTFPSSLRAGISYEYEGQCVIGADFTYTWWKEYSEYGNTYDFFRNTYSVNAGAELKNNPQATTVARRFAYRIGGFFQNNYTAYTENELYSYGFTVGLGIPVRKSRSLVNVGLQFGQTGSLKRGQIRENFMRVGVSFSSMETWFVKPKYD